MTAGPPEVITTADGTQLAVRHIPGDGQPIVALHGFTGDGSTMEPLVSAVRAGRPAMLIDCVGHGRSDAPETLEPYMMSSVVDQVLSVVGSHAPGVVHLMGYSMGGRIALSVAARAPWHFASVTTLSATPGMSDPIDRAARHDADLAMAERIETDGVETFVDTWLTLPIFAPMISALDSTQLDATRTQRLTNSSLGLANSLRGTGTGAMPPVWSSLPGLRSPFLALAGALDQRYVDLAREAAASAPFGRAEVVPDAGHALHTENPGEVAPLIREFLKGCEAKPSSPETRPESSA
jgi:2-succinyl-6-hydroxy-2,4-cyclohexadiene-1-carboxylate synthase